MTQHNDVGKISTVLTLCLFDSLSRFQYRDAISDVLNLGSSDRSPVWYK